MSWQKCPLCDGKGYTFPYGVSDSSTEKCSVCDGQKIISTITGKPPAEVKE